MPIPPCRRFVLHLLFAFGLLAAGLPVAGRAQSDGSLVSGRVIGCFDTAGLMFSSHGGTLQDDRMIVIRKDQAGTVEFYVLSNRTVTATTPVFTDGKIVGVRVPPDYFDWLGRLGNATRPMVVEYAVRGGVLDHMTIESVPNLSCPNERGLPSKRYR